MKIMFVSVWIWLFILSILRGLEVNGESTPSMNLSLLQSNTPAIEPLNASNFEGDEMANASSKTDDVINSADVDKESTGVTLSQWTSTKGSSSDEGNAPYNGASPGVIAYFVPEISRLHPSHTETVYLNISLPVEWTLTPNFTAVARSQNRRMVTISGEPDIGQLENNNILVTFDLKAEDQYGTTSILVSTKIWTTTETVVSVKMDYPVEVERPSSKAKAQDAFTYINFGLCLVCLFMAACDVSWGDIRDAGVWIAGCVLFQVILMPVFCLALVEVFNNNLLQTVGIMTVGISPAGLLVVPFAAMLQADMSMIVPSTILSYLVALASMPIWSLQLDRLAGLPLRPGTVPYTSLFVLCLISLLVTLLGALLRHYHPASARKIKDAILVRFSSFVIAFLFVTTLTGGNDLLEMVQWKEGLSCFLWTLAVSAVVAILFATTASPKVSKMKAVGIFLLLKSPFYGMQFLNSTLRAPLTDAASIGAYFFAVMTLLGAMTLTLVYVIYQWLAKREKRGRDRLVYEVQVDTGSDVMLDRSGYENSGVEKFYGKHAAKLVEAQLVASAWGTPAGGWICN